MGFTFKDPRTSQFSLMLSIPPFFLFLAPSTLTFCLLLVLYWHAPYPAPSSYLQVNGNQLTPTELGGSCGCPRPAVITDLCHCPCRAALSLGDQELKQDKSLTCASLPCFFPGLSWIQDQLFTPTLSSHLHHDIPAYGVPGGSSGPACGPGSGVPRVCLQRRQLLQTHALPSHGHLLHDHSYLLHSLPDESEEIMRTQLL